MKLLIQLSLVIVLLLAGSVMAQECGPNCPACSGAGSSTGALITTRSLTVSALSIPDAEEESSIVNVRYGLLSWLDAGLGYAFETETVLWNVRVQPIVEQKGGIRPAVIIGSGSVQAGGADQSLYLQLIKTIELSDNFAFQLSGGVATLLPDHEKAYGLGGISFSLYNKFALFASYDGKSYHEGISWIPVESIALSALLIESESAALSLVVRL